MSASTLPMSAGNLYVVFVVAGTSYVLPAVDVLQMESFTEATPVPGALPYVLGVIHVRGRVVPVVDLRVRLGLPPMPATLDSRVVVVSWEGRTVALLADSAREVVKLTPDQLRDPPGLMLEAGVEAFVRKVAHVEKRLLLVLDAARILGARDAGDAGDARTRTRMLGPRDAPGGRTDGEVMNRDRARDARAEARAGTARTSEGEEADGGER